jgi:hypothetical protein
MRFSRHRLQEYAAIESGLGRVRSVDGGYVRVTQRKHQAVKLAKDRAKANGVSAWLRKGPPLNRTFTKLPS